MTPPDKGDKNHFVMKVWILKSINNLYLDPIPYLERPLYSGHLVIADTLLSECPLSPIFTVYINIEFLTYGISGFPQYLECLWLKEGLDINSKIPDVSTGFYLVLEFSLM